MKKTLKSSESKRRGGIIQNNKDTTTELGVKSWSDLWTFATYNLQGKYKNDNRRIIENTVLTEMKIDFLALQDLGVKGKEEDCNMIFPCAKEYESVISISKSKDEAEMAISCHWKKNLTIDKPTIKKVREARAIVVTFEDQNLQVINIYVSPRENDDLKKRQIEWIREEIKRDQKLKTIIMGDMNELSNVHLDRWNSVKPINTIKQGRLLRELKNNHYTDTYRMMHPNKREYTRQGHYRTKDNEINIVHSRLDYIWTSPNLTNDVISADIIEEQICDSDHRMSIAQIAIGQKIWEETYDTQHHNKIDVNNLIKRAKMRERFKESLEGVNFENVNTYTEWKDIIVERVIKVVGRVGLKPTAPPFTYNAKIIEWKSEKRWISKEKANVRAQWPSNSCILSQKTKDIANKYKIYTSETDSTTTALDKLHSLERKITNKITHQIREMERTNIKDRVKEIIKEIEKDRSKVYKILKRRSGKQLEWSSTQKMGRKNWLSTQTKSNQK
jgi:exonuclease III